jgi:hypothetical protein
MNTKWIFFSTVAIFLKKDNNLQSDGDDDTDYRTS